MSTRFVIYSEEMGVYLGYCLGLGFWSKMDHLDLLSAVTFEFMTAAEMHMASWVGGRPEDVVLKPVEVADSEGYATIAEIIDAGLPGWIPKEM